MQTNPNIILAGQQFDLVGAMDRGNIAGQRNVQFQRDAEQYQRQNILNSYVQDNAPGIMSGNQNALNGLAGLGTEGLAMAQGTVDTNLGREQTRLGMDATRQGMRILDERRASEVAQQAAQMSAQQRAQEAAQIERATGIVLSGQTPEMWDALAQQHNMPELVGQFAMRDSIAAEFMDIQDILEMNAPPEPTGAMQTLMARAAAAGLQPGTPEYQQFMASGGVPSQNTSLSVDPETGQVSFTQGTGEQSSTTQKVTERQSQLQLFSGMMRATSPDILALEEQFDPSNLKDNVASRTGTLGNYLMSPEGRRYRTASAAWAEGVLRIQTGAAATQPEIERVQSTYFAVPGDDAADMAQKKVLREAFLESIIGASGGAVSADSPAADLIGADQVRAMTPEQLRNVDIKKIDAGSLSGLTDEQWQALGVE